MAREPLLGRDGFACWLVVEKALPGRSREIQVDLNFNNAR